MKKFTLDKFAFPILVCLGLAVLSSAPLARADWNPGDPYKMHYPQLPDLTPTGLDVLATYRGYMWNGTGYTQLGNKILADDFLCTQTGPITGIHIWGSWLNDAPDPLAMFHLSIHADIPAGTGGLPYSTPGTVLWQMNLAPTQQRIYASAQEHFYDPNTGAILGPDTQVWQYNFFIPPAAAFLQTNGTIYWLDVQYFNPVTGFTTNIFGWKTSLNNFNDDAVFGDNVVAGGPPVLGGWRDLHDPFTGQSLDLAFVISDIPEPSIPLLGALAGGLLLLFARRRSA
jgi:hypothetical protein